MKEYIQTEYKPIIVGIVAYFALFACNELYVNILIKTGIIKLEQMGSMGDNSWNWHPLLLISTILQTLIFIVPGFLSGRFSDEKGALNGIIVISICCTVIYLLFSVNHEDLVIDVFLFIMLLQQLIMPVAIGAVSGAAGQYQKLKMKSL